MSSGKKESVSDRLAAAEARLDAYEASHGVPSGVPESVKTAAMSLLDADPARLAKMPPDELEGGAYSIRRYSLYLQSVVNRERSRVRWAEENMQAMFGALIASQRAYSPGERKAMAIRGNEAASALERVRVEAQLRLDRVGFLKDQLEGLASSLLSMRSLRKRSNE
jgi:hypothetical protein